jgi:hypothetical protein
MKKSTYSVDLKVSHHENNSDGLYFSCKVPDCESEDEAIYEAKFGAMSEGYWVEKVVSCNKVKK